MLPIQNGIRTCEKLAEPSELRFLSMNKQELGRNEGKLCLADCFGSKDDLQACTIYEEILISDGNLSIQFPCLKKRIRKI